MRPIARAVAWPPLAASAILALAGVGGRWSAALDVVNSALPPIAALLVAAIALLFAGRPCGRERGAALLVLAAGAAAALGGIVPEFARPIPAAPVRGGARALTVMTANLWVRNVDPDATLASIRGSGADVVLLQETNGRMNVALAAIADVYPYRSRCWVPPCGLTILSRTPFLKDKYRFRDEERKPFGPKLEWARLLAPDGRPVTVATIHYPWPLPRYRQDLVRADLAAALRRVDVHDMILTGDMNLSPWSFAMRRQDRALAPMIRVTRALFSWPARDGRGRRVAFPLLPIDQIYAGPGWASLAVKRMSATGSDHYPVLATFRRK